MTNENEDYTTRARKFRRDDFWKQVRRTVNGEDVSEDQINLIIKQINDLLKPEPVNSTLLDVGCGNGALTARLIDNYSYILGVDPSDYLIEIAKEYFTRSSMNFEVGSANSVSSILGEYQFSHGLMYGVSSFVEDSELMLFIEAFFASGGNKLMIGNVRDLNFMEQFYLEKGLELPENTIHSVMGKWRSYDFFEGISQKNKITVERFKMPSKFYANAYYFDLLFSGV